jgi:hypothetical protein
MAFKWLRKKPKECASPPPYTELVSIATADEPQAEVVFIHGLDGDPIETWDLHNQSVWKQSIVHDCPCVNIWALRYRLRFTNWRGGAAPLPDRALNILATIGLGLYSSIILTFFFPSPDNYQDKYRY